MVVGFKVLLGVSGVALASVDIMHDVSTDDDLQLLQVSAGRHQQDVELNATGGLVPENTQGPYTLMGPGTDCPDDQRLSLRQCSEASWHDIPNVANVNPQLTAYGSGPTLHGPSGCWYHPPTRGVYYNQGPTVLPLRSHHRAICGVAANIDGGFTRGRVPTELPPGGVEHLAVNTECDECGLLNIEQCAAAMVELGLNAPQNRHKSNTAVYWPMTTSWQNPDRKWSLPNQKGPRGCFTVRGHETITYFSMDLPGDEFESAPHPNRRPICGACPTTTTTTTPEPTTTTTPEPTTAPATLAPTTTGDSASAVDDPHVKTVQGVKYDVAH